MSQPGSLPANVPRRLSRRPHLAAALLRWRNAFRLRRARTLGIGALCAALVAVVLAVPPTGAILQWFGASPIITFAVSACLFGLSAVRRQERMRSDAAISWLAALPVPSSSVLRLVLAAAIRLLAAIAAVGLAWIVGWLAAAAAVRLVYVVAAGALTGTLAGSPLSGGAATGSPGWHYASVRRARPHWATAPSLVPLSYWPVAQGRIFSRPRTSRVMLFALLAIPAGRRDPGEVAIAVAAGCLTVFTLLSLSTAAVRAAGDAARWLAPTTIRRRTFVAAFIWQVAVKQAAVLAVVILLSCAVDYPQALRVGSAIASAYLAISCAAIGVACVRACHRVGLGAAGRGT
ncbi:MAG: hypothetical protein HIU85_10400 [Proteobacteria bacterium]|nr:hypothetical protein [Pseudomonadota bacterium]